MKDIVGVLHPNSALGLRGNNDSFIVAKILLTGDDQRIVLRDLVKELSKCNGGQDEAFVRAVIYYVSNRVELKTKK